MDIGAVLREARQQKGRTLRQISATTKIAVEILEKIERNQFDGLPGGIFRRGYIRAFASDVGLDPEPIVAAFRRQVEPPPAQSPVAPPPRGTGQRERVLAISMAAVLVVAGAAIGAWLVRGGARGDEVAMGPSLAVTRVVDVADTRVQTPHAVSVREAPALRFEAVIRAACWVEFVVDGRPVLYRMMQAGEPLEADAEREIVLKVGDASAVDFTINGLAGRPLGTPGQVVTVTITEDTYRGLVVTPPRQEVADVRYAPAVPRS